jgi:hypothetical protein
MPAASPPITTNFMAPPWKKVKAVGRICLFSIDGLACFFKK